MKIIAGPCSIETYGTLLEIAHEVKDAGAQYLRGGAFKPRTSPHSFQGLGKKGLEYLKRVGDEVGLKVVSEMVDVRDLEIFEKYVDIIQIGSRNMMNYNLLKEVGKTKKPILLKRGFMATIKEFILSAEYIENNGNKNVILCERGIRTFETATRNTFDINAIPILKKKGREVIADPSHGTGVRDIVPAIAKAALAAGADGLMIEVHTKPDEAVSDGDQSLLPKQFKKLMEEIKK